MANVWYDKGVEAFAAGQVNWGVGTGGDTIKAALVDAADYTFSQAHQFLSDVPAVGRVAISPAFTGKTLTAGTLDADDITWPTVSGDPSEIVIVYKDTGNAATSPLLLYIDTATGLPVTPNGGDIGVTWSNAAGRIAVL